LILQFDPSKFPIFAHDAIPAVRPTANPAAHLRRHFDSLRLSGEDQPPLRRIVAEQNLPAPGTVANLGIVRLKEVDRPLLIIAPPFSS